jgi:hypothetical protein
MICAAISFAAVWGLKELTHADISSTEANKVTTDEVLLAPID